MNANVPPVVSAIITTFERVELLKGAVKSVLSQSYTQLEIIVVDDASNNNDAAMMINDLNDDRIRLIKHDDNKGVSAARNTGIKNAKGEYVAFLDDDDIWLEDKIEQQLNVINDTVSNAVLTAYYVVKNNEYFYVQKEKQSEVHLSDLRHGSLYGCSGLLVQRKYAEQLLFDETIGHGEDWDFVIRLSQLTTVQYINRPLFILNDGGHPRITNKVNQNISSNEITHRLKQLDKHSDFLGKYWRKYHEVCLYLGYISNQNEKYKILIHVANRHGVIVILHVILKKACRRIRIILNKKKITTEYPRIYRIL